MPKPSPSCLRPRARLRAPLLALCLGLATAWPSGQAQVNLPALGDSASDVLPVAAERRLGEQIMLEIRRDPDYLDDPLLLAYVQSLWQPLVQAARRRGDITPELDAAFSWELFLVRDRGVNAFALPGGFSGVYLGLVAITQSGDEVAAVLAHELTHVTQRHVARGLANASQQNLLRAAGTVLAILAAARSHSVDATQAAYVGAQAAAIQGQLNFSRDMEREADRIGHAVLQDAGFAPAAMSTMFERLELANRLNDNGAFPYLRSHPITGERISDARERLVLQGSAPTRATALHLLMRARARVLMDPGVAHLRRLQGTPAATLPAAERLAAHYGAALASLSLREWGPAQQALQSAQAAATELPPGAASGLGLPLAMLQAELWLEQGRHQEAALALNTLAADAGTAQRAVLLMQARTALAQGAEGPAATPALRQSMERLQTWVTQYPQDASAWAGLGKAAAALNLPLRALRAEAEAAAAKGDLAGAIERMRRGQALARGQAGADFIEASVLDSRLKQLQAQRRALLPEVRNGPREGPGQGEPPSR